MARLLILSALLAVANAALPARNPAECVNFQVASSTNAFPGQFQVIGAPQGTVQAPQSTTISFAQGFNVTYFPTYKLVTNLLSFPKATTYALYQCGMDPPPASALPAGTQVFQIPLRSVAVEDTTNVAFMSLLGLLGRVSFVTQYAVNPCMQSLGAYGCKRLTSGDANNFTKVDVDDVDGILGFQTSDKTISVSASGDPGPLNRAEWIKFVATFFNKEDVANQIFTGITTRYNTLKTAIAAQAPAVKPVVAWIIFMPAGFGDPDQVQISFAAYKAQLTQDAGGQMLDLAKTNATALKYGQWGTDVKFSFSSLIFRYNNSNLTQILREVLADVDVLIEESRLPNLPNTRITLDDILKLYGFQGADIQNLKFIKNNKIVRQDAQSNPDGYTAWFEQGVAQPDVVLQDLAKVITPAAVSGNAPLQYLRVLGVQPSVLLSSVACPLLNCQVTTGAGISNAPICPLIFRDCSGNVVAATATQRCAPTCPPAGGAATTPAPATTGAGSTRVWLASLALACISAVMLSLFA